MARVSIFTPTHNPRYLYDAYLSLKAQTEQDWQWVVLANGAGVPFAFDDARVLHVDSVGEPGNIGALKAEAVSYCTAPVIVELDHDDILEYDALEKILTAFDSNPDAGLVYSQYVAMDATGKPVEQHYNNAAGWESFHIDFDDKVWWLNSNMPATPNNVSYIWFAPNHVRAFTRRAYDDVGGYRSLEANDDQDLMCRLYLYGEFVHIDEILYRQRFHGGNYQLGPGSQGIQDRCVDLHFKYIQDMVEVWSERNDLEVLEMNSNDGIFSLASYGDSSVGVIYLVDVLQHVAAKVWFWNELYRVLAPGGMLFIQVPSTDGRGAFQDPSHVAFYNENSFWYFTDDSFRQMVPGLEARFQADHVSTTFYSEWHEVNDIPYVQASLIAIKPGTPRNGGELRVSA